MSSRASASRSAAATCAAPTSRRAAIAAIGSRKDAVSLPAELSYSLAYARRRRRSLYLAAMYLLLAVPFFTAGSAIGLALAARAARIGAVLSPMAPVWFAFIHPFSPFLGHPLAAISVT